MPELEYPELHDPEWLECHRHESRSALAAMLGCSVRTVYGAYTDSRADSEHGNRTHGASKTPAYRSWAMAKYRCTNPASYQYAQYGGRGITFCERWQGRGGFDRFFSDVGERPLGTSLERINNERGYEPGNCRWATTREQAANRRNNTPRKLTDPQVRELRALWHSSGQARSILDDLAEQFGLSYAYTERIVFGHVRQDA